MKINPIQYVENLDDVNLENAGAQPHLLGYLRAELGKEEASDYYRKITKEEVNKRLNNKTKYKNQRREV